jgi:hypothetical protein
VNPARFKAPYLSALAIEQEVSNIRNEHGSLQQIPVDVLAFAEFDLQLHEQLAVFVFIQ